jgi:uncharacterized protein with GYD domain
MSKYMLLFSLKGSTMKGHLDKPSDRSEVVRNLAKSAGGDLDSYYWMFGQYDGMAIVDMPDSQAMASVVMRVASSDTLSKLETCELFSTDDIMRLADQAKALEYQPIGS